MRRTRARWKLLWLRALALYLRNTPEHPGRWRLLHHGVRLAPVLRTAAGSRVIRVRDGFRLRVDGSSQSGRIAYVTGDYERETVELLRRRLRRGEIMIDVGANIGYFSLAAARIVGPHGRVFAFEPAVTTRALLQENVRLNRLDNVVVREEALGATPDERALYLGPAHDTGLASLRPLAGSATTTVRQVPFDDIWRHEDRVALVKIDVEGAELAALEGMTNMLQRDRPDIIVEVTDSYLREFGTSASSLFDFLASKGYRGFRITSTSLRHIPTSADLASCPAQFNALFSARRGSESSTDL